MKSEMPGENCFICCAKAANFHSTSDSELNICHIICQHFWFKEDDLRSVIVCEICWEKVDQFHQFYLDVQKLHGLLKAAPSSIFIKQEEVEIEEDQFEEQKCIDLPLDDQKPFDIVDCKLEIEEKSTEYLNEKLSQVPRKKRKYTPRTPDERIPKRETALSRKLRNDKKRKTEDDFIKQHTHYFCEECNMEFENFKDIKEHQIKTHNKKTVVCCGKQHLSRLSLYNHVQYALNPEVFKCEFCSGTFKNKGSYLRHKKENHTDRKEFKCHRCEKSFPSERLLKFHLKGHQTLDNETAKCEFCGKCFPRKLLMIRHIKSVHQKETNFICEICSMGFHVKGSFVSHLKRHELAATEQRRKQCPVCNKWLKNHAYWQQHVQRHKDDGKEFKCEVCGHVSINLASLKEHIRRNHGPNKKSHLCTVCGKKYSQRTTLREHVANAHTGEPLYACKYCDMKFFSNATMYKHRKKDHPQEWLEDHLAKYATTDSREEDSGKTVF